MSPKDDCGGDLLSVTAAIAPPLYPFGFRMGAVTPSLVNGRFTVSEACCQPFKVLHGGVSALIAETLASIGTHVAGGFRRIAGMQLAINHHRPAALGEHILAEGLPVSIGKRIQVWQVRLWKVEGASEGGEAKKGALVSSATVTMMLLGGDAPVPDSARAAIETLRKHSRL